MNGFKTVTAYLALAALVAPAAAAPAKKPSAADCSATATLQANVLEYQIAELEGRTSPAERAKWSEAQLAEFERDLARYRPKAKIARAVADKLVDVDTPDALFDKAEALSEPDRDVLIQACHSAYVK